MNNQVVYIVTHYGCNSTPSHMWTPKSKIFINYEDAYDHFLKVAPDLNDESNKAEQFINNKYNAQDMSEGYIVIENRVQISGYHSGECNRAKRPQGVVISRSIVEKRAS